MNLKKIREIFWPKLDSFTKLQLKRREEQIERYSKENIRLRLGQVKDTAALDTLLELAEKLSRDEELRVENVERKAALILGFSGIMITLNLSFMKFSLDSYRDRFSVIFFLFLMFVSAGSYLLRALLYSVDALRRRSYDKLGEGDILQLIESGDEKKELISLYLEKRVRNFDVVNDKVSSMHMAVLFFKRSLLALFLFTAIYFFLLVLVGNLIIPYLESCCSKIMDSLIHAVSPW